MVLTDAPDGPWTLTTSIDVSALDQLTDQAGLMVWRGEDPNNFAKLVYLSLGASGEFWIERSNAVDGSEGQGNGNTGNLPGGPTVIFLRITSNGATPNPTLTAHYSLDGATWSDVQAPFQPGGEGQLRIGLTSFQSVSPGGPARHAEFDWIRLHAGADREGPVECAPPSSCLPQSDEFDGTALDPKWDVLRPTGGVTVSDGRLSIPINAGDWIANDPLASDALLQDAPSGEWTATARLDTSEIGFNGQAGLVIWKSENPNTFSKIVVIQSDNNRFEHIVTQDGGVDPPIPESITPAPGGQLPDDVLLRARYDGSAVIAEFSADNGQSWTLIGQEGHAAPFDPPLRVGLTAFGGGGTASFDWFRVHAGSDPGGPIDCGGGGGGDSCDEFEGTELDPKWEIVNPSPTNPPTVGDGHLNLPIIQGDLFGDNGTAQMVLQGVPADQSWVLTAKIAHANIDTNGEAAGLALVNTLSPPSTDNHFAKTALQFKNDTDPDEPGDQPGVWAERVLTADSQAVTLPPEPLPYPNSGALDFEGDYGWVRFVHDAVAQEIGTWTSTDGETFVNFGQNMPVDEYLSEPGGLRAGLFAKHDGSGDDVVQIDAFNVVLGSADPQTPPDECNAGGGGDNTPPTTTATLDPAEPDGENGWFTTPVEVTLAATDNEGGSGVESTLYAIDGGDFTDYEEPFTVSGDGEHEVEFRSTDAEGNLEATKSLAIKIDGTPPETEATVDGREVTLEADDGPNGSGVAETRFRIDDGPWQTYVDEETILGSESDLGRWAQAGPGGLNWLEVTDTVAAVTASAENPPDEVAGNLVDGDAETKWLAFESTGWVEFELSEPSAVVRYSLTSANDAPGRDPSDWTLQGSDDGETWTELDQQSGQDFADRFQTNVYEFENETAYGYYRLDFTANSGDDLLQLADVELSDGTSGFARTQGGLGMPWYPVKDYGDFSLKMEWRDSSEGANGNSGVFVRFPDPRIPLAERPTSGPGDWDGTYCGRTGAAATQQAWVAIYCGQEIQINDHQGDYPEDRLDLQLRPGPASRPRDPAEGHLGRLRGPGRGPAVHGDPQRHGADRVRQLDPARVLPRRRPPDRCAPVRSRLHRAPEPRHPRRDRLPERAHPAPGRGLGRGPDRGPRGHAHGPVPLDRRGRQRRGDPVGDRRREPRRLGRSEAQDGEARPAGPVQLRRDQRGHRGGEQPAALRQGAEQQGAGGRQALPRGREPRVGRNYPGAVHAEAEALRRRGPDHAQVHRRRRQRGQGDGDRDAEGEARQAALREVDSSRERARVAGPAVIMGVALASVAMMSAMASAAVELNSQSDTGWWGLAWVGARKVLLVAASAIPRASVRRSACPRSGCRSR